MSLFSGWEGWRKFKKLPWDWRNIVIYSESGQDWHQFEPLIGRLGGPSGRSEAPGIHQRSDGDVESPFGELTDVEGMLQDLEGLL